jgi:hypothetical protein
LEEDENLGKAPERTERQPIKVVVANTLRTVGSNGTSVDMEVETENVVSMIATPKVYNNGKQPDQMNVEHCDKKGYEIQMEKVG